MTFKRFLGIGIATIIYGLCAVGWADVKPADPKIVCQQYFTPKSAKELDAIITGFKSNAALINDQYYLCFSFDKPLQVSAPFLVNLSSGEKITLIGLQMIVQLDSTHFASSWASKTMLSISGSNVTLQDAGFTGPGSAVAGSIGVALSGSGHAIINSTITGFDIAVKADCLDSSVPPQNDKAICTIGPKVVTDNVKQGVVVPTTGQGVTITQNELRTVTDPYGDTTQKIVLQGAANGGLTPPTFSVDPATMTIWKTLSDDGKFVTAIGGVLPKNGVIELFEHHPDQQPDMTYKYKDYFRASCPTTQNDKGLWEFKCAGLNIDAVNGQVFVDATYTPNTSAMTKLIDVKNIPEFKITAAVNPGATISGGSLTDAPAGGDGGTIVGGAGETVAMSGPGDIGSAPPPDIKIDDASTDGGTAAAMTGGVIAGDAAPSAPGASAGCGGQLMPEKTPVDPTLFVILLMPIVILLRVRWSKGG